MSGASHRSNGPLYSERKVMTGVHGGLNGGDGDTGIAEWSEQEGDVGKVYAISDGTSWRGRYYSEMEKTKRGFNGSLNRVDEVY